MGEVVKFFDLLSVNTAVDNYDELCWRIDPGPEDEFEWYRRDDWKFELTLTKRFRPVSGDQLTFRNGGKVEFLANDADNFWVRTVPDGTYLTCHKTTFKESDND